MAHRVLLCDDEVHILKAAEFKLARAGYDVQCAADGQEAWEAILASPPDMLITDCQMPRMSGIELVERIRSNEPTIRLPILMLTAKGFELSQSELIDRWGLLAVMGKPFSPRELLAVVAKTLGPESTTEPAALTTADETP